MKMMNRFALLAVLGAIVGSAALVGCGGGSTETTTTEDANGNKTTVTTEKED